MAIDPEKTYFNYDRILYAQMENIVGGGASLLLGFNSGKEIEYTVTRNKAKIFISYLWLRDTQCTPRVNLW